jgi:cytochrome bd-type quinol oxidase subunit 2
MFKNLRKTFATLAASLSIALVPVLAPVAVYAADTPNIEESLSCGSNLKVSPDGCEVSSGTNEIQSIVTGIVNIFSIVVGIVAVIMIIVGGFKYITSGGDSGNITSAKNTIIYAIIGLVVVALAQFIVQFVLDKTFSAGNS